MKYRVIEDNSSRATPQSGSATSPGEICDFQPGAAAACAEAQRRQCVLCQTVVAETDDFKTACDVALVNICRHPERGYTVVDEEGLDVLADGYE